MTMGNGSNTRRLKDVLQPQKTQLKFYMKCINSDNCICELNGKSKNAVATQKFR